MAKEITVHLDLLGRELSVGSVVAAMRHHGYSTSMCVCRVTKINPKKVTLEDVKKEYAEWLTYSNETVKLSSEEATAFILKYA
jgi:hypothetical protein